MKIQLRLNSDFDPIDATYAVVDVINSEHFFCGKVTFRFDADEDGGHRIITDFQGYAISLPYYVQAKIVYDASMMVDAHFAPDAREPLMVAFTEA